MIDDFLRAVTLIDDLPTPVSAFMAHHAVPYGRTFRQWRTDGRLIVWVNRGQVEDLPRASGEPSVLTRGALYNGIPIVNA